MSFSSINGSEVLVVADLLKIRARNGAGITWEFVDESMVGYTIELDQSPTMTIAHGDIWQVELVDTRAAQKGAARRKTAVVRLITKIQELHDWERIVEVPNHWIDPVDLKCLLVWLHTSTDVILIGPQGSGKTTLCFRLARALGWQDPCKVDVYTIKKTTDLFGSDAARDGSTFFRRSALLDYIERAHIALEHGEDTQFLIILDEINRVHPKSNESMHGLFDETRQVTFPTAEGSRTIRLPLNIHTIGTMNMGAEFIGTHPLDVSLKDRFQAVKIRPMPIDYEVAMLVRETGILEKQALDIVQVAMALRTAANNSLITFSPSYRYCRNAGRLVRHAIPFHEAVWRSFRGWYEGDVDERGNPVSNTSEVAKAYSAMKMKGAVKVEEIVAAALREVS